MSPSREDPSADRDDASRRVTWPAALAAATSLPVLALAIAALTGVGLLRGLSGFPALTGAVAIVALPVVGLTALSSRGGSRVATGGGCAWLWSLALLFALPFYFPGERADASRAGLRLLAAPLDDDARARVVAYGDRAVALLGEDPERLPEAIAVARDGGAAGPNEASSSEAQRPRLEGEVVLPYEGEGQVMRVSVFFDGPRYGDELPLVFDTGATYTTLTRDALARLEVEVPPSAPVVVLRTANGEIEAPLVLVDAAWLGEAPVEWVTVAVCDLCAGDGVAGLLGLNVSGQFHVSLDHEAHEIRLTERAGDVDRKLDVAQWVRLGSRVRQWESGRAEVEVTLHNLARVPIHDATARIDCDDASFEVPLYDIPAGGAETTRMALPHDTDCRDYGLELTRASWQLDRF